MKKSTLLTALMLCMTVPVWGVYAAVPDFHPVAVGASLIQPPHQGLPHFTIQDFQIPEGIALGKSAEAIEEFLYPGTVGTSAGGAEELARMAAQDLEIALQDELMLAQDKPFWTRTKKIISGLLLIGIILGILFLMGGGGSGGGGGGDGGDGSGGGDEGGGDGGGAGTTGDDGGGSLPGGDTPGTTGTYPDDVPTNPEPSSLMLLGLGLLLPYLRKKKSA